MLDTKRVSDDQTDAFVLDVFLSCVKVAIQQSTAWDSVIHRTESHLEGWIAEDKRLSDSDVICMRNLLKRFQSVYL